MKLKLKKLKKFILKPWAIATISLFLIIGTISAGKAILNDGNGENEEKIAKTQIKTIVLGEENNPNALIEAVGVVKAKSQVDIVSVARGTLRAINFKVGDQVNAGSLLANLFDSSVLTSLNNANTNFINTQSNLSSTERLTNETVRQAELGIQSAEEQVEAARIGVKAAEDNLTNAKTLKNKSNLDTKNSAVISVNSYLNTIFTSLDQVDSLLLINEEDEPITSAQDSSFGAEKSGSVANVLKYFKDSRNAYLTLSNKDINTSNITETMSEVSQALQYTELMIGATITALDNSVTSITLSKSYLDAQKSTFIGLRSSVVASQTGAKTTLQTLQNLDLFYNSDIEALENALEAAKNQLTRAETGLENAKINANNALEGKEAQLLASRSQVDNARGQLSLAQTQAGDLRITSPISGQVTKKFVDLGQEINPGTPIAQVSQTDALIVELSIPIEDANKVESGQIAEIILDDIVYEGIINQIDPVADSVSRKVNMEILITSADTDLFVGTFVEVKIKNKNLANDESYNFFVPLQVLTTTQNEQYVFVEVDGKAEKRIVEVGETEGRLVEIMSGLNKDDALIVEGAKLVEDGQEVEVIN